MKPTIIVVIVLLLAAATPLGGAAPADDARDNRAYFLDLATSHGWPVDATLLAQVDEAAWLTRGIDMAAVPGPIGLPPGVVVGEMWIDCGSDFTGSTGCSATNDIPTGVPGCYAIPAHWAAYVWVGNSLKATLTVGSGGSATVFAWTASHAGIGPLVQPTHGGTLTGSVCLLNLGFLVLLQGDGIYKEA